MCTAYFIFVGMFLDLIKTFYSSENLVIVVLMIEHYKMKAYSAPVTVFDSHSTDITDVSDFLGQKIF